MLLLLILPFIALPLSIAGMVIAKKKDRKGLVPGTIGLALSVIEIIFVVITFLGYLRYEKAPGHSLDIVSPFFETSSEAETSGSEQEIQSVYTTGTKQLTLEDVIEMYEITGNAGVDKDEDCIRFLV